MPKKKNTKFKKMKNNRREFFKKTASVAAVASMIPMTALGQEFLYTPADAKAGHVFLTKPFLQNPTSNSMTVMWIVNLPSFSYVEYGETKEFGLIAKTVESGLVVAYNRINKIELSNLQPGKTYFYRVVSKEITKFEPYSLLYGKTITSETYRFTTQSKTQEKVSMLIFNDIHDRPESIPHLLNLVDTNDTDVVFFNGDVFDSIEDENQIIDHMLIPSCDGFSTQTPFYFVRGNHETRGKYSRNSHLYFENPMGKEYYSFVWGNTHFTVIDTGEDKPDDSEVYAGIVDFDSYRVEQLHWFNEVIQTKEYLNAKFRVVLMHIPMYYSGDWHGTTHLRKLFSSVFNTAEIDMCISGHTHSFKVVGPTSTEDVHHNYPIIIGGGPKVGARTITDLKADATHLKISMIRDDGKVIGNYSVTSKR